MESTVVDGATDPWARAAVQPWLLPPALWLLFFLSGASGLIYEVVWLRMLSRTLGSTVYATSTILAVFMGGLALGSFLFGRIADRVHKILRFYALIEAGIGMTALLSLGLNLWPIPLYRLIYHLAGNSRTALTVGQVLLVAAGLLIPTTLMGATLPALCAYGVRRSGSIARVAGTLYGLNTLGAMVGVIASGFVLIGSIGETHTIEIGAAINGLVAILALLMLPAGASDLQKSPETGNLQATIGTDNIRSRRSRRILLLCFAMSGFVSLAMEIVWSRMLALYTGTSIYAFSSMLAVMLCGIGLGGWIGRFVERWKDPLLALARIEMAVALFAALSVATFANMAGYPLYVPPLMVVGPTSLLLGIAFTVIVYCYTEHARSIGRRVGELYAWNTFGCILGSLAGGFLLVPRLGTAGTGAFLAGAAALIGILLLSAHPRGIRRARLLDLALLLATVLVIYNTGDPYFDFIHSNVLVSPNRIFAAAEETPATTVATGVPANPLERHLYINGAGMTALVTGNKLMADLPYWFADSPHDALVICLGMGTTFRSAVFHKDLDVTVVELVPAVPRFMHYFHKDADLVMAQPNAHVVVDDGRNYLLMHERLMDTITIDPAPPLYSAGTVNLYTKEFFELCSDRLSAKGAMCLWIPPGPVLEVKMIMRAYATVFPYVSVWGGPTYGGFFLIGTHRPVTDVAARIRRGFADHKTLADLTEWDNSCSTPEKVLALHVCDRDALLRFTSDAPLLTDDHPYTEFPLWRTDWKNPGNYVTLDSSYLWKWLSGR